MTKKKPGEIDFEAALRELEQIVEQLEAGDLPLERSLALFEQGVGLSRDCQKRLDEAERRVEILLKDEGGGYTPSPFEEMDE
ncbi:MAG: exodeoxyribonuclease VII small subunit [Blastocatellia bacterium]